MKALNRILQSIIVFIVCLYIVSIPSEASMGKTLDSVIVNRNVKEDVIVPYSIYKTALRYGGNYYHFLSNNKNFMEISGVASSDKFIKYSDYKLSLRYSSSVGEAIENAPEIDSEESSNYIDYDYYEYDLSNIRIGEIFGQKEDNHIYFEFPQAILDSSINNVGIESTLPIKIHKFRDKDLEQIFVDKLKASGYPEDMYFGQYNIPLGKDWKYSHIIDATKRGGEKITVVNEHGLIKDFYVYFKIVD